MAVSASRLQPGEDGAGSRATTVAISEDGGAATLPSGSFIADGQFTRVGADLVIRDAAGNEVVVQGYFLADDRPALTSPDGTQVLTAGLIESFLTPVAAGQYAQTGSIAVAAPVGQVLDLEGNAFAIRADGTRVQLAKGDSVHEGDIVETGGAGSAIRMVFTDKTEFSLGADARLALDQLVFNPDTQAGTAQFSVLKGVFIFASGQIAKTDNTDMTVITPVATIGIRGTEVAGRVSGADSQFTVIDGAIDVLTQGGSVTLDAPGETTQVAGNDAVPSDPVVLTAAQFGQAYGDVAGVVSGYFNQSGPGPHTPQPGGVPEPSAPPTDSGGRAESRPEQGGANVAGSPPPETENPAVLAATFAEETQATAATDSMAAGSNDGGSEPVQVVAVPGLEFASGLTFEPSDGSSAETGGVNPFSATGDATPQADVTQVALAGTPAMPGEAGVTVSAPGAIDAGDLPQSQTAAGSSDSPFRSESGTADTFGNNPYVTNPFGYSGPQLGDPVFGIVAGETNTSGGGYTNVTVNSPDVPSAPQIAQGTESGQSSATAPAVADITLVVSNATLNQQHQDLTHSYELPNKGTNSFDLIPASKIDIPAVPDDAEIRLQRDAGGNVDVSLTSAWDSVKNIRAESDTAADITIDNFVHADVHFGDGGDSHVAIYGAKRGFITTGNGNDKIEIEAYSNGPGWSHTFDVASGAGDDILIFDGASNGLSSLVFDGGEGTDTLRLSGAGQSFSLLADSIQVANVERIDISGVGSTTLTVPSNLFDPSDTTMNTLTGSAQTIVIDGDSDDTLDLHGNGWNQVDTAEIDGRSYAVYEHASGMRVAADVDLQVT